MDTLVVIQVVTFFGMVIQVVTLKKGVVKWPSNETT